MKLVIYTPWNHEVFNMDYIPGTSQIRQFKREMLKRGRQALYGTERRPPKRMFRKIYKRSYKNGLLPMPATQVEKKWLDTPIAAQDCSTTGALKLINAVSQGSGQNQRVGVRFNMFSIYVQGEIQHNNSVPTTVKLALIYDRKANGSLVKVGDNSSLNTIYDAASTTLTPWTNLYLANGDRFTVLGQCEFNLTQQVSGQQINQRFKLFKSYPRGLPAHFNGAGSTYDYFSDGSVYFVSMSNIAIGTTPPTVTASARIRFTDD